MWKRSSSRDKSIKTDIPIFSFWFLQVHKRSNEICLQLYEKELLTDTSYLHIYGLQEHELNAKQLAIVSVLHHNNPKKSLQQYISQLKLYLAIHIVWNATENSYASERIAEQLKKERLEQLAMKGMQVAGEDTKMTPSDADNDRSHFDPADQSCVAPLSMNKVLNNNSHQQVAQGTVQELNRPMAFGALVGNSTSGRQSCIFGGFQMSGHRNCHSGQWKY